RLDDVWEGAIAGANLRLASVIHAGEQEPELERLQRDRKALRGRVFLNCWHMNEYESAAMWKVYLRSNEGVAIQSTFGRLISCLGRERRFSIYIGRVAYIDYRTGVIPESSEYEPFLHKRKSFEYEREVRALIDISSNEAPISAAGGDVNGIGVDVDL